MSDLDIRPKPAKLATEHQSDQVGAHEFAQIASGKLFGLTTYKLLLLLLLLQNTDLIAFSVAPPFHYHYFKANLDGWLAGRQQ